MTTILEQLPFWLYVLLALLGAFWANYELSANMKQRLVPLAAYRFAAACVLGGASITILTLMLYLPTNYSYATPVLTLTVLIGVAGRVVGNMAKSGKTKNGKEE